MKERMPNHAVYILLLIGLSAAVTAVVVIMIRKGIKHHSRQKEDPEYVRKKYRKQINITAFSISAFMAALPAAAYFPQLSVMCWWVIAVAVGGIIELIRRKNR
jgi:hypothetical protein